MQCGACGSEWKTNSRVNLCPFCGQELQKDQEKKIRSVSDVIAHIVEQHGVEILQDTQRVTAFVKDLARECDTEKKLFRILCNNNILVGVYEACVAAPSRKQVLINHQLTILKTEAFLPDDVAAQALNILLRGVGEKEIVITPAPEQPPVSSEENTAQSDAERRIRREKEAVTQALRSAYRTKTLLDYRRELNRLYEQNGRVPLTREQIEKLVELEVLDKKWGASADKIEADLQMIYEQSSSGRYNMPASENDNHGIKDYRDYRRQLKWLYIKNGLKRLTTEQIQNFITENKLDKRLQKTVADVEDDLSMLYSYYKYS